MSRFIQLHLLTSYPPANLNRDDLGRPKTAKMGGVDRLRVSSQSLKRAWRTSEIFENAIAKGTRTKFIGKYAFDKLSEFPKLSKTEKDTIAKNIAKTFGSLKGNSLESDTLAFVSNEEMINIDKVISSFQNGLGSATVETNCFGVHLFKALSSDIQVTIEKLLILMRGNNEVVLLGKDWDKPKGMKEIIKSFKSEEDKSGDDCLSKMLENVDWMENISGDQVVRDDQLELYFADSYFKLTKDILKKLSLGSLLSGRAAKDTEYGPVKNKSHIKLCEGWEGQIDSWVEKVRNSEDDDFTSDDNIQALKLVVSPGAIPKSAILTNENMNADIAMFGRMLADSTRHNVEAACQVAHAISVHSVALEDDYFSAVEEMNEYRNDAGAAHIGETGFAAGLFYSYICLNRELLLENLGGDRDLADRAVKALIEAAVKVAPTGKQNSFGSRAYASYVMVEKGDQQPRSLSVSFLKPITRHDGDDFGESAVQALAGHLEKMDRVYGACADERCFVNAFTGEGTLTELLDFVVA